MFPVMYGASVFVADLSGPKENDSTSPKGFHLEFESVVVVVAPPPSMI